MTDNILLLNKYSFDFLAQKETLSKLHLKKHFKKNTVIIKINNKGVFTMKTKNETDKLDLVIQKMKLIIPNFEIREEQYTMMKNVYKSMLNNLKVGVHAPTGTGKSLGYLIPYIAIKLEYPEFRITISTYTKPLQEQLIKEIEMALDIYNLIKKEEKELFFPLKYEILKGKSNYFCHFRFQEAQENLPEDLYTEIELKVNKLIKQKERLEEQNLALKIQQEQWEEMCVEGCKSKKCDLRHNCTYYQHYYNNKADICIVNHALFFNREFFVEEAWEGFDFNVFDEAHKLEKVILDSSTFELSENKIEKWIFYGANIANRHNLSKQEINDWLITYLYKNEIVNQFKEAIKKINNDLEVQKSKSKIKIDAISINYEDLGYKKENFERMLIFIGKWKNEMFFKFKNEIANYPSLEEDEPLKEEIDNWETRLNELGDFYRRLKQKNSVLWIDNVKENTIFKTTPGEIKDLPNPFLRGVLFTSGTLAQQDNCQNFASRLNLTLDIDKVLPTPFNLAEKTLLYCSEKCNPKDKNQKNYKNNLEEEIFELIKKGEMKTFVLFSSKSLMNEMYERLKIKIENFCLEKNLKIEIWVQNSKNYKQVVSSFKDSQIKTILFGVLTYFEGIDLKGNHLTQVILTRLPYAVPTHPIQKILDKNHNYSKWEAMIRFEQAFGRLIRTQEDYGSFCVLDSRINNGFFKDFLLPFEKENVTITKDIGNVDKFYKKMKK